MESAAAPAKKRILIVDDEVSFARMVKLNLEKTGQFEVRAENRANNALAAARDFKPDLIFLDVIMPSMDGGDVKNQLKRDRLLKDVPIVFLTATVSQRESGASGLNSAGDLFLAKPITVEALIHCIHQHSPPAPTPAPPAPPAPPAVAAPPAPSPVPPTAAPPPATSTGTPPPATSTGTSPPPTSTGTPRPGGADQNPSHK